VLLEHDRTVRTRTGDRSSLEGYRAHVAPEGSPENDEAWDDVCTAMAVIAEDLGVEHDSF
jgi:hypothetical protein